MAKPLTKPDISKGQMEKVMQRIEAGEADILDKVRAHFTLTQEQEKYLTLFIQTKHLRP
jgi:hypothetical protein